VGEGDRRRAKRSGSKTRAAAPEAKTPAAAALETLKGVIDGANDF